LKTITLPEPQINTILERLHAGAYMPEIAAELEVVPSTLRKILIRQAADRYAAFANRPQPTKEQRERKKWVKPPDHPKCASCSLTKLANLTPRLRIFLLRVFNCAISCLVGFPAP